METNSMDRIIHFAVPRKLSSIQSAAIDRARQLHPGWNVMVWRDPIQKDGFLLEQYWPKVTTGAGFADLLRLDILYRFGGVYIDSDIMLLRPLDDLIKEFEFVIASEDGFSLTNAFFGARKGSQILRALINELLRVEPDWTLPPNISTGPIFFSQHLRWRKEITVIPRESFYSYNGEAKQNKTNHRQSYGEHLWAASWKPTHHGPTSQGRDGIFRHARSALARFAKRCVRRAIVIGFEQIGRQQSYQCSAELVVQTSDGLRIVVDGNDVSLTPELVFTGTYEASEQNFLRNTAKGGDWVIDVGSNVGSFSLLAAKQVGPFGRVFAFDPNPRPSKLMAKSLVMNWLHDRVIQRTVAVGENSDTARLTFSHDRLGDGMVGQDEVVGSTFSESLKSLGEERLSVLEVKCVRLDDEFSVDLPIKILKIDVEGYEGHVLAGADRLLGRRCIDFVIIELLQEIAGSRWHETLKRVSKVMDYGYALCTLTRDGSIVEQKDIATAIRTGSRNFVLAAQEQYMAAGQPLGRMDTECA
jgi:FkbM family methyltransferase